MCGSVHSVFESTVNILFDHAPPGSAWVSLHAPDVPMHPHAVLLDSGARGKAGKGLLDASAGETARLGSSGIVLGAGRATVRLEGAAVWNPWLEPLESAGEVGRARLIDTIVRSLEKKISSPFLRHPGAVGGLEGALIGKCLAIRQDLLAAWRGADMERAARAMTGAVGLGSGLTPSGDDFLTGFLGAAHFFAFDSAGRARAAGLLSVEMSMTTAPAFFMIKGALAGFLPEPLSRLLRALAGGDGSRTISAARQLVEIGATSGQDMLAGVICYLEAVETAGEVI
jgi:hypothetical protein